MFSISVSHNALKALALCAGTCITRPMLTGICIDTTTPGRVHLVTTDGHRMLIVGNAVLTGEPVAGRFIVPLFEVKAVKQRGTERYPMPITIDIDLSEVAAGRYSIHGKETRCGLLVDGRFPEWQRVLPKRREGQGKTTHFNFGYVGDFGRAAELMGCKFPHIVHNGEGAATVYLGADAFGVLMPIRADELVKRTFVDWLEPVGQGESVAA